MTANTKALVRKHAHKGIEFDAMPLEKGDSIAIEDIEAIGGVERGSTQYALFALQLMNHITAQRPDLTVKVDGGVIRVLTDQEASEYLDNRFRASCAQVCRVNAKLRTVDMNNLSVDEARRHDHSVQFAGGVTAAMISEVKRQRIAAAPHVRTIPGFRREAKNAIVVAAAE